MTADSPDAAVHGVLIVERDLSDADTHGLVQRIDDDLVWTADQPREDFLITVYRGAETGVISDRDTDEVEDLPAIQSVTPRDLGRHGCHFRRQGKLAMNIGHVAVRHGYATDCIDRTLEQDSSASLQPVGG